MHCLNKEDENHSGYSDKYRTKKAVESYNEEADHSEGDQPEQEPDFDLPDFPEGESEPVEQDGDPNEQDTGEQCCNDPTVAGEKGDRVKLDNGNVLELDKGEQICLNCEEIHE